MDTIWDDRVLNRAYQVFGNRPAVVLETANNVVPQVLKKRLAECTTPPRVIPPHPPSSRGDADHLPFEREVVRDLQRRKRVSQAQKRIRKAAIGTL